MLGISVYPYKENIEDTIRYIEKAANLGYKRMFLNLLLFDESKLDKFVEYNKKIIEYSVSKGFEIFVDVNPNIMKLLNVSYNDLKYFYDLGISGIRLDETFNGDIEAELTYNQYDLKIELNASQNTEYIKNILMKKANIKNLVSCHNFYPQKYTGLSEEFYIKTSSISKKNGLRLASFVTSQFADHGPHEIDDKLPTLEIHRNLPIDIQVKHLIAMGDVDDIIISNAYASEEELKLVKEIYKPYVIFKMNKIRELTEIEKGLLMERHVNRGDRSDSVIRSSKGRIKYKNNYIEPKDNFSKISKGTVYIANSNFAQYKGEVSIALKDLELDLEKVNIVGKIDENEVFLLDYIEENSRFGFCF